MIVPIVIAMTLDEVLLGVKNQSNIDISCSHSMYDITVIIMLSWLINSQFQFIHFIQISINQSIKSLWLNWIYEIDEIEMRLRIGIGISQKAINKKPIISSRNQANQLNWKQSRNSVIQSKMNCWRQQLIAGFHSDSRLNSGLVWWLGLLLHWFHFIPSIQILLS